MALVLAATLLPTIPQVNAGMGPEGPTFTSGNYKCEIIDTAKKHCSIYAYTGKEENIVIPETLNGYSVTRLDWGAFAGSKGIKTVVVPKTVTSIGYMVFEGCVNLKSITIPWQVADIDPFNPPFEGCPNLTIRGYTGSKAELYANEETTTKDFIWSDESNPTKIYLPNKKKIPFVSIGISPHHVHHHSQRKRRQIGVSKNEKTHRNCGQNGQTDPKANTKRLQIPRLV